MLSFPVILTIVFLTAGGLLGVILLVVLLPRRDENGSEPADSAERRQGATGRNGDRFTP